MIRMDRILSTPAPRPEVLALAGDSHGGPDYAELGRLGLAPEDVLDFSASTNAFGPPPGAVEALAACDVTRYPDRGAAPLRQALAEREGVGPGRVLVANGAAQLIWTIALAYLQPGDTALVAGPTFGEYRVASQLMGARVHEVRPAAEREFRPDLDQLCAAATYAQRVAWLCNPNNPTGAYLSAAEIVRLIEASPATLWVIDEAYRPFVDAPWDGKRLIEAGNTVLMRSLTKDCALPGVRIGYALASGPVIEALGRALPPWSAGTPAIAAGLAALRGIDHVQQTTALLRAGALRLQSELRAAGWTGIVPSATHFFLVQVGDGAAIRARLLAEHRIQVRDCASFGLPDYIRLAARLPQENARLCRALESLR